MRCEAINDTKQTQCKSKVKKGFSFCPRHLKKPSIKTLQKEERLKKQNLEKPNIEKIQEKKVETIIPSKKQEKKVETIIPSKKQEKKVETMIPRKKQEKALRNMEIIFSLVEDGYKFPAWSIEKMKDENNFQTLMQGAKVYYHKIHYNGKVLLSDVMKLVRNREPVNIEQNRHYDKAALKKYFGYSEGYYDEYFSRYEELAPNIAVFTPAIFKHKSKFERINIINSIGLAFDTYKQSDYQNFFNSGIPRKNAKAEILFIYKQMFEKIYACADDHKFETVVLSAVGMGYFKKLYPGDMFMQIFIPAFKLLDSRNHKKTLTMGFTPFFKNEMVKIDASINDIGYFPECTEKVNLSKTLFVNAWDPLSLCGNGNESDNSVDGFIGRSTTIGVTSSALTNPFLEDFQSYIAL